MLETAIAALWSGALLFQIGSVAAALAQPAHRRRHALADAPRPPVSILIPTHATGPSFTIRLAELLRLDYENYEIIIASEGDEPEVRRALAALAPGRIRVDWVVGRGADTFNPKVNVLAAAFRAARHETVFMTDDNAVTPPGRLGELVAHLHRDVGLVSSAVVGVKPQGFAAELDAAFMNGYVARYFQAADRLGFAFAIGKSLLVRRGDLERAGGVTALADGMAEDSVLREKLLALGLRTVLSPEPALQELDARTFAEVLRRHLRWMAHRRTHAPLAFLGELVESSILPWAAAGAALGAEWGTGTAAGAALTWAIWLVLDAICSAAQGWPLSWRYPLVWSLRELLIPAMWGAALVKRRIRWRGRKIDLHPRMLAGRSGAPR